MPGSEAYSAVCASSAAVCCTVIVHSTPWFHARFEKDAVAVSSSIVTVAPDASVTVTPSTAPIRSAATVAVLATGETAVLSSFSSATASASGVSIVLAYVAV